MYWDLAGFGLTPVRPPMYRIDYADKGSHRQQGHNSTASLPIGKGADKILMLAKLSYFVCFSRRGDNVHDLQSHVVASREQRCQRETPILHDC